MSVKREVDGKVREVDGKVREEEKRRIEEREIKIIKTHFCFDPITNSSSE